MKHFTCDKCGMPMNQETTMRIDSHNYEICTVCQKEIMKGLDGKGTIIPIPNLPDLDVYKKYIPRL